MAWVLAHHPDGSRVLQESVPVPAGDSPLGTMRGLLTARGLAPDRHQLLAGRYDVLTGRPDGSPITTVSVFHLPVLEVWVSVEPARRGALTVRVVELRTGTENMSALDLKVDVVDATIGADGRWDRSDRQRWMAWAGLAVHRETGGARPHARATSGTPLFRAGGP